MNRAAVPHDVAVRGHELLERGIDVLEIDVGDEAIDAGVDAGRLFASWPRGAYDASKMCSCRNDTPASRRLKKRPMRLISSAPIQCLIEVFAGRLRAYCCRIF
jgi:hypothetical protein